MTDTPPNDNPLGQPVETPDQPVAPVEDATPRPPSIEINSDVDRYRQDATPRPPSIEINSDVESL